MFPKRVASFDETSAGHWLEVAGSATATDDDDNDDENDDGSDDDK